MKWLCFSLAKSYCYKKLDNGWLNHLVPSTMWEFLEQRLLNSSDAILEIILSLYKENSNVFSIIESMFLNSQRSISGTCKEPQLHLKYLSELSEAFFIKRTSHSKFWWIFLFSPTNFARKLRIHIGACLETLGPFKKIYCIWIKAYNKDNLVLWISIQDKFISITRKPLFVAIYQ